MNNTWQEVLNIVEKKVNRQSYNTWFKPTQLIKHDGRALIRPGAECIFSGLAQ